MKKIKEILNHFFIDGLTGMAWGLFSTLIIGLIITQIASFIPGRIGTLLNIIGKIAQSLTGAGIGVGVAVKFKSGPFTTVSAGIAGLVGAFASKIIAGDLYASSGAVVLSGPGEPLGAFIAAIVAIEIGNLIAGKTSMDIILVPSASIIAGSFIGLLIGPPISEAMLALGSFINWAVEQQPIIMGIIVSVVMGMILTLPISSAAISIILNLSGLAAGAATVGCCANMIGFAVASFRDNKISGLVSQGLGTSMLQVPNILKKPIIWLPAIVASAILGPISTTLFKMTNNASRSWNGNIWISWTINDISRYGRNRRTINFNNKNNNNTIYITSINCMVYNSLVKKKEFNKKWGYEIGKLTNTKFVKQILM